MAKQRARCGAGIFLARRAASGLSVAAFCRREKLSQPSFYSWRRTIAQRDRQRPKPNRQRRPCPFRGARVEEKLVSGRVQASGASGSVVSSRAHTSGRNCVSSSALGEPAWLANSGSFASTLVR